jgi:hypothetical protein
MSSPLFPAGDVKHGLYFVLFFEPSKLSFFVCSPPRGTAPILEGCSGDLHVWEPKLTTRGSIYPTEASESPTYTGRGTVA